ncbi:chloride channel CLIC-like protein 1 isoform X2 [Cardiocondyla obscurior]|uniref:chloride channel CLIC-like protein 1 isoform X2 n=1 Tax=Cardiocondyla obscurior TaxID=286306 RepID=UPI0039655F29
MMSHLLQSSKIYILSSICLQKKKMKKIHQVAETRKNEQSLTMTQPCSCRVLDERNTQEAIFYKRLINILLSNFAMQKIDDRLIGTLGIDMSSSQFEYLQNFINGQGSIREVDRILDNAIKQSEYSTCHYLAEAAYYFDLFTSKALQYWTYCLLFMKEHWDIPIISFIVILGFMIFKRQKWSRGLLIFLTIDVICVISFFITWWRLIKEAEIKLMAAQAQFAEMPITCQPHKMGLWDKILAYFSSTNDCEKYYETIMTNPTLQVTPAFALTYFLSTVIFQPLSYFGVVISEFVDNATGRLNIVLKYPVVYALFLSFCGCIVLIPFIFIGGYIKFGFGPFSLGLKGRQNSNKTPERIERIYEETPFRNRLKDSKKLKQITLKGDNDFAGGDAGYEEQHQREKRKKCKSESESEDVNGDVEYEKKS